MNVGAIIFDSEFAYADGSTGRKLMAVLSNGANGRYIVALTTSQPFRRSRRAGCQSDKYYPGFYLPDGSCCLRGESWIALGELHELDVSEVLRAKFANRINHVGELPPDILKALLNCAINCDDTTIEQEQILIDMLNAL